jgi:benzoyl-CoA reductase/2-hydroxyglutaryl-CoA dehydratase subunit BcrC/BadD/HgdB
MRRIFLHLFSPSAKPEVTRSGFRNIGVIALGGKRSWAVFDNNMRVDASKSSGPTENAAPQDLDPWSRFDQFSAHCLVDLEAAKEAATIIAGIYCIFAPTELIRAAGAIPVGLCGKQEAPIAAAEQILPSALCPLIKSSYGYAVTNTCPFFDASDVVIGETTCDGKKKMFESMAEIKPLHLMHLPYTSASSAALEFWYSEILRLKRFLEKLTCQAIQMGELARQINLQNQIRLAFQRLLQFNRSGRIPINGMRMLSVLESKGFVVDQETYLKDLDALIDALDRSRHQDAWDGSFKPRILLTGTPLGRGSEKVLRLIEDAGGVVVCMENCTGIKSIFNLVDETDPDPIRALAKRYLKTPCACMTPNTERLKMLWRLVREYQIDGIVDLTWQCCHAYHIESTSVEKLAEQQIGIPFLHIATDYSPSDTGQLGVRIEAFLELLKN